MMETKAEIPKFQGISDPKCRCTTEYICVRCAKIGRYGGKFGSTWAEAVKKNNEEVKGRKP